MKQTKIKIFLLFLLFLIILSLLVIVLQNKENSSQMEGNGLDCFKECGTICYEKNTTLRSFTTTNKICNCICSDNSQNMFKIE